MKPVASASDITGSLKGGIVLNMTKSIGGGRNFNYKLKAGDMVNSNRVEFDRNTYFYIVNMLDSYRRHACSPASSPPPPCRRLWA